MTWPASPSEHAVNYAVLRSLQRAVYSPEEEGHYALASECYCHFTSPIRRYPDLTIHRLLDAVLTGKKPRNDFGELAVLGEHCSDRERRAEAAERELTKVKLLNYLSTRIGEELDAVVTGVEEFGLFVQGIELPAEGLMHVASLQDDYLSLRPRVAHAGRPSLGQQLSAWATRCAWPWPGSTSIAASSTSASSAAQVEPARSLAAVRASSNARGKARSAGEDGKHAAKPQSKSAREAKPKQVRSPATDCALPRAPARPATMQYGPLASPCHTPIAHGRSDLRHLRLVRYNTRATACVLASYGLSNADWTHWSLRGEDHCLLRGTKPRMTSLLAPNAAARLARRARRPAGRFRRLGDAGAVHVDRRRTSGHAHGRRAVRRLAHGPAFVSTAPGAEAFLDRLVTRRVADMKPGQIRYALVTNDAGGILDDVLVYRLALDARSGAPYYLLVVNASNREKICDWLEAQRRRRSDVRVYAIDRRSTRR